MKRTHVLSLVVLTLVPAITILSSASNSIAQENQNVVSFVYDYQQGNDGSGQSSVPFYLDGYGLIEKANEHEKALAAFRRSKYEGMDIGNSSFQVLGETSIAKVEQFLPNDFDKSKFQGELTATPVLVSLNESDDSSIWLLVANKDSVVALFPRGHWKTQSKQENNPALSFENFLFMSVFEGLQNDGVGIELARSIANEKHGKLFVDTGKGCDICDSIKKGFESYVKLEARGWGKGLDEKTVEKLKSSDPKVRHRAFQVLISRYVKARFETTKFSGDEKKRLLKTLESERGKGMANKTSEFGAFCPSCDGSCSVCQLEGDGN